VPPFGPPFFFFFFFFFFSWTCPPHTKNFPPPCQFFQNYDFCKILFPSTTSPKRHPPMNPAKAQKNKTLIKDRKTRGKDLTPHENQNTLGPQTTPHPHPHPQPTPLPPHPLTPILPFILSTFVSSGPPPSMKRLIKYHATTLPPPFSLYPSPPP